MMIQFSNIAAKDIRRYIADSLNNQRPVLSNFFFAENNATYTIANTSSTVLIRKKEETFYRLYVVTIEEDDAVKCLLSLKDETYIINLPTKGDISQWNTFMEKSSYESIGHYKRLFNTKIKSRKSALNSYAKIEDVEDINQLLSSNFCPYIDYLPTIEELKQMVENHQILADYDESGKICGVLIYTLEGKKCYLNAWIDFGTNGLFLLYKAYNIAFENNIQYLYFWVNSQNTNVLKLHEMMGAKYDGLNDYTYKNKRYNERKDY